MVFWWLWLPLAVLAGAGLMAVIQRAWPQRSAVLAFENGYGRGWDKRDALGGRDRGQQDAEDWRRAELEPWPPTDARRRPGGRARPVGPVRQQAPDLVTAWENMPPPVRRQRSRRDTMDLVTDAYLTGKSEREAAGEVHHVPGPASGQPPARLGRESQDAQDWAMAGLPPDPAPRSVLRELGIEPGRVYPGGGWESGACVDGPEPAGGGA